MRRLLRWSLAVLLACALLYGAFAGYVSWRSADSLVHPERAASTRTPAEAGLAFEAVTLEAAGKPALAAWWVPAEDARGTVVFLHGYGDSKAQALGYAPFLHEAGYHVLAVDFRAHGASGGDFTTVGMDEADDVARAYAYAVERGGCACVALLGLSMGGAAALNAAPGLEGLDAVVTDSAFATLQNVASNSITHFTGLPKYPYGPLAVVFAARMVDRDVGENRPVDAARGLAAPLLVVQGTADTIAFPDADGRAIAEAAGAQLWLVEGATHVGAHAAAPDAYERRVLGFLDQHVS